MIQEPFAYGNTPIHRIDARLKIVFAAVYSVVIAVASGFPALIASIIIALILTLFSKPNTRELIKRLAAVNSMMLLFWVIVPFTFKGDPYISILNLSASEQGIMLCVRIMIKANAIILVFISMAATEPASTIGRALYSLRVPGKLIHLLMLTYRYMFVIEQEYNRLLMAAKVRCFRPKTSLYTYRTFAYLAGMIFVRASARAESIQKAMRCRGFNGKFYSLHRLRFSLVDTAWAVFMVIIIIGLEIMEWKTGI